MLDNKKEYSKFITGLKYGFLLNLYALIPSILLSIFSIKFGLLLYCILFPSILFSLIYKLMRRSIKKNRVSIKVKNA